VVVAEGSCHPIRHFGIASRLNRFFSNRTALAFPGRSKQPNSGSPLIAHRLGWPAHITHTY
jgi:hypothetical protein